MTGSDASPGPALHAFLVEVGRALIRAGTAVSETQERLGRIAGANHAHDAHIVVLPTALMISTDRAGPTTVDDVPQVGAALRLDQVSALYRVVSLAERGQVDPVEGLRLVRAIGTVRPRYGRAATVSAYTAMTVGLSLIARTPPSEVALTAGLGTVVGCLVLFARAHRSLQLLVPVLAALLVTAVAVRAAGFGLDYPGLRAVIIPLMTFLPGSALTTATVELASGQMIAGASRLVWGTFQLLLLALGIVAGAELAGLSRADISHGPGGDILGGWAPWLGVVLFGAAVSVHFSAPPGVLRWLLLVLVCAWLGQTVGDRLGGPAVSGFVGASVMTPVALIVSRLPGGPPSQVTFLPAFWLLVPGASGLVGVTTAVADPAAADPQSLVTPMASMVAIALGVLCGASVHRGLDRGR